MVWHKQKFELFKRYNYATSNNLFLFLDSRPFQFFNASDQVLSFFQQLISGGG